MASMMTGGLLGMGASLLGGLFSDDEKPAPAAPPPPIEAPPAMPTPNDAAAAKARSRSIAKQMQRKGRQSTIMSQDADVIGGGSDETLG